MAALFSLSYELFYCRAEIIKRFGVSVFYGMCYAVRDVLVYYLLAEPTEGGTDGRQLNKYVGAVLVILYHFLDMLQMPYDSGDAVELAFLFLRRVVMVVHHRIVFFHNINAFRIYAHKINAGIISLRRDSFKSIQSCIRRDFLSAVTSRGMSTS